jgi:hypothetical protein
MRFLFLLLEQNEPKSSPSRAKAYPAHSQINLFFPFNKFGRMISLLRSRELSYSLINGFDHINLRLNAIRGSSKLGRQVKFGVGIMIVLCN